MAWIRRARWSSRAASCRKGVGAEVRVRLRVGRVEGSETWMS